MNNDVCLNCNQKTTKHFCANCGQKTDTHRIELKHFIIHDLLHGVWHFEKGIFFTIKETIVRPGKAALDYISGKRIRYYNVFYLSLLAIAANALLNHFYKSLLAEELVNFNAENKNEFSEFLSNYFKIFLFAIVPILALNAMLIFKRLRLNFAEHLIMAGIALLGILFLHLFSLTLDFANSFNLGWFFGIMEVVMGFIILLFPSWVYSNAFAKKYTFWGFLWRIVAYNILVIAQMLLLILAIALIVSGKPEFNVSI